MLQEFRVRLQDPRNFLLAYIVFSTLLGVLIVLTYGYDNLLVFLTLPVIYAASQYKRRVYLPSSLYAVLVCVVVIWFMSQHFITSLGTLALLTIVTLLVCEIIYRLRMSRIRFERELYASEQRFRNVLEDMQLLVITLDLNGNITFCNEAFLQLVRLGREEVLGKNWFDTFASPTQRETMFSSFQYRIKTGTLRIQNETEIQISPGIFRLISWNNTFTTNADGQILGATSVGQDITETRRSHRLLQESERRYRTVFETMAEAFTMNRLILDEQGTPIDHIVIEANDAYESSTGLRRASILNRPMSTILPEMGDMVVSPTDSRRLLDIFAEVAATGIPVFISDHYSKPLNQWYTLSISSPEPGMFAVASTNITLIKETEAALRESEARYRMLISQLPMSVQVFKASGLCVDVNPAHLKLFGVADRDTLVGTYNITTDPMARQTGTQQGFFTALKGEQSVIEDVRYDFRLADPRFSRTNGIKRLRVTFFPVRNERGMVELVVALNEDLTKNKEAEGLLKRQAIALETMYDGVIITGKDNRIVDWNQGASRIFGYPRDEALGRTTSFLHHQTERQDLAAYIHTQTAERGKWTGEVHCVRKDGSEVFCEIIVVPLYDENGNLIATLGVNRDITERKQAEDALLNLTLELEQRVVERTEELAEQKARLQTILDTMADGVIYTTRTHIQYVNTALVEMIGYPQGELIGQPIDSLQQLAADKASTDNLRLDTNPAIQSWMSEVRLRHKNGLERDVVLTSTRMNDGGTVTLVRDISQEKLLQTQKDRFITNASHEFRTPIANIKTRLYLMRRQPHKVDEHLQVLENVTTHMTALLEELLEITRFNREAITLHRTLTNVQELVESAIYSRISAAKSRDIKFSAEMPERSLYVMADRKRLTQAFAHLLTNAIRYTPESHEVLVRLYPELDASGTEQVVIDVCDSSAGIPAHLLSLVFEPFFRPSEGAVPDTGTGLALARQIIQLHDGSIEAISEPGDGTIIRVRLASEQGDFTRSEEREARL